MDDSVGLPVHMQRAVWAEREAALRRRVAGLEDQLRALKVASAAPPAAPTSVEPPSQSPTAAEHALAPPMPKRAPLCFDASTMTAPPRASPEVRRAADELIESLRSQLDASEAENMRLRIALSGALADQRAAAERGRHDATCGVDHSHAVALGESGPSASDSSTALQRLSATGLEKQSAVVFGAHLRSFTATKELHGLTTPKSTPVRPRTGSTTDSPSNVVWPSPAPGATPL